MSASNFLRTISFKVVLTPTAPASHYLPWFLVNGILSVPAAGAFSLSFAFALAAVLKVIFHTIRFVLGRAAVECSQQGALHSKGSGLERPALGPEAPQ